MIEASADADDVVMEKYLEGEISNDEIRHALRRGTLANILVPVLCGSSFRNKGIQPCSMPSSPTSSPVDVPAVTGTDPRTQEPVLRRPAMTSHSPPWRSRSLLTPTSAG